MTPIENEEDRGESEREDREAAEHIPTLPLLSPPLLPRSLPPSYLVPPLHQAVRCFLLMEENGKRRVSLHGELKIPSVKTNNLCVCLLLA